MGVSEDQLAILPGTSHIGVMFERADLLVPMVAGFFGKR